MTKTEILSPVGDFESLYAAINSGADAVYLGMGGFNARIKAKNFDEKDIAAAVEYAHLRGVKVYMTVNTLVYNDEFDLLVATVKRAIEAGVDAFIVQDLGVARVLQQTFSGIELHASTQLGVHNLKGALVAEKLGFKRVVLARETKLGDIREIKDNTNLEIEFFVQGALCSSFSGNCLISSFKSGNSGNRGRCAQLCRLKYSANKKSGYFQSTKDLCLLNSLKTLCDAGVTSFKIEGRLRRAGYVAVATRAYRAAMDDVLHNENRADKTKLESELRQVFSRGKFNQTAYLYDDYNKLNTAVNNHQGVKIGKVERVERFKDLFRLEISSSHEITVGDGLKFFENGVETGSLGVGSVQKKGNRFLIVTKSFVKQNADVYLTLDYALESEALKAVKPVTVDVNLKADSGHKLFVTLKCLDAEITHESNGEVQKAKSQPLGEKDFKECFNKGEFTVKNIKVDTDGVFMPKSELNEFRRQAFEKLRTALLESYKKPIVYSPKKEYSLVEKCFGKRIIVVSDLSGYNAAKCIDGKIAISPSLYFEPWVSELLEREKVGLNLPIVASGEEIKKLEKLIFKSDFIIANNVWGLFFADKVSTVAGTGLNVFNNYAINAMTDLGVKNVVMSLEVGKDYFEYGGEFYYSLGYPALMNFVYCPFKEIYGGGENNCDKCYYRKMTYTDDKGNEYFIRRVKTDSCRFELLDGRVNSLSKHSMNEYLDLRNFDAAEIENLKNGMGIKGGSDGKLNLRIK